MSTMSLNNRKYKVAVVILNWNGKTVMERYLPYVVRHSEFRDTAIIVVDNNSTDDSVEWLAKNYPSVERVVLDSNYGFAGGYNRGLVGIDSEYFVLLNSDVRPSDGWLEPVIRYMDENPDVAVCQPKLMSDRYDGMFEYAGAAGGFIDKYGYPFCRGRIFSCLERDNGQYDDRCPVMWASGAAFFVRSDIYRKAGGFDESFFAHMEEIDLCWRIRNMGYAVMYVPDSVVYHLGAATLQKENPYKTYLNFRNNLFMLYKNLPDSMLKKVMQVRSVLDFISFMVFLLTFKFSAARAVRKARKDFKSDKCKYKRDINRNCGNFPVKDFSIVCNYYLFGRKIYKKLP